MGMAFADEIIHKSTCTVVLVDIRKAPGGRLHDSSSDFRSLSKSTCTWRASATPSGSKSVPAIPEDGAEQSGSRRTSAIPVSGSRESGRCKENVDGINLPLRGCGGGAADDEASGSRTGRSTFSVPPTPYGMNSKPLEKSPSKASFSREEMLVYYQEVLQELIRTGRARFFAECSYESGLIRSVYGKAWPVSAKKLVEAYHSEGPVERPKPLPKNAGVCVVAPEDPSVLEGAPEYLVVGAGKVGMNSVFWLLENGIDPDMITWILPDPSSAFWLREQMAPCSRPCTPRRPSKDLSADSFQCSSLTHGQIQELRRVTNVVRMGHVTGAEVSRLLLERGQVPLKPGAMVLDCTEGLETAPKAVPIWQPGQLVLQTLAASGRAKSAALIAAVELQPGTDEEKNQLFKPATSLGASEGTASSRAPTVPPTPMNPVMELRAQTPALQLFKAVPPARPQQYGTVFGELAPPAGKPPPPPPKGSAFHLDAGYPPQAPLPVAPSRAPLPAVAG
eukprot:TRINITY_DN77252_c0_g1_i1.p1 TRINITY_DN77252_c0_g1~~TRINITY_DN77252_c0_g1_i1.p1  ORF type:complete len:571 (+),score=102.00 TRINITY_DN77252_c0_g1_i1:199-1713(+)